jgi:hypothetical protein
MKAKYLVFMIGLAVVACNAAQEEKPKESVPTDSVTVINGVERSELALLMRKMYDEMKLVKDSIEQGMTVRTNFLKEFERIQNAHATEPEKIDETYHAMASAFLDTYATFEGNQNEQARHFNIMLQNCLVCHQNKCPGPVKAIKKLSIKPSGSL